MSPQWLRLILQPALWDVRLSAQSHVARRPILNETLLALQHCRLSETSPGRLKAQIVAKTDEILALQGRRPSIAALNLECAIVRVPSRRPLATSFPTDGLLNAFGRCLQLFGIGPLFGCS